MLITGLRKEDLEYFFCIYYPVQFKKNTAEVQALIKSRNEVNVMVPAYAKELSLRMRKTNVRAQKIDASTLETYGIVITGF